MNIIFIGAGNLATHLSQAFQRANHRVLQVYSRTEESASSLAALLDCPFTTRIEEILPDAEVYVFSVRDAVLQDLAERLYAHLRQVAQAACHSTSCPCCDVESSIRCRRSASLDT